MRPQISKKTTGWTEETRDQFHPGDILSIIKLDYCGYAPSGWVGPTELAGHYIHNNREWCQPHIDNEGKIYGFYFNVFPLLQSMQQDMKDIFPEIASFGDTLTEEGMKMIFSSEEKIRAFQLELQRKFGDSVQVVSKNLSLEERKERTAAGQIRFFSNFKNASVIVVGLEEEKQNEASSDGMSPRK